VGNGTQVRIAYDLTGDGSWDRTETYRYFATDPVAGFEHHTGAGRLSAATGTLADLRGGSVRVRGVERDRQPPDHAGDRELVGDPAAVRLAQGSGGPVAGFGPPTAPGGAAVG